MEIGVPSGGQQIAKLLTSCKKLRTLEKNMVSGFGDIRAGRTEWRFDLPPSAVQQLVEMVTVETQAGAQNGSWPLVEQDVVCGLDVMHKTDIANLLAFERGLAEVGVCSGDSAEVERCERLASGVSVIEITKQLRLPV